MKQDDIDETLVMQKNLEHKKWEEKFSSHFYTTTVDIEPMNVVMCYWSNTPQHSL